MAPKIAKKIRSKVAQEKGNTEQGEPSRGEKRPNSSLRPLISPASKRSKTKHNVPVEDRFHAKKFIDLQTAHLYKALGNARTSDSKVFDF